MELFQFAPLWAAFQSCSDASHRGATDVIATLFFLLSQPFFYTPAQKNKRKKEREEKKEKELSAMI